MQKLFSSFCHWLRYILTRALQHSLIYLQTGKTQDISRPTENPLTSTSSVGPSHGLCDCVHTYSLFLSIELQANRIASVCTLCWQGSSSPGIEENYEVYVFGTSGIVTCLYCVKFHWWLTHRLPEQQLVDSL